MSYYLIAFVQIFTIIWWLFRQGMAEEQLVMK